jgi:hypothetical protein
VLNNDVIDTFGQGFGPGWGIAFESCIAAARSTLLR